jgi:hypothetical protein
MPVDFQLTMQCYIPEDRTHHNYHRENPISYVFFKFWILQRTEINLLTSEVEGVSYIPFFLDYALDH